MSFLSLLVMGFLVITGPGTAEPVDRTLAWSALKSYYQPLDSTVGRGVPAGRSFSGGPLAGGSGPQGAGGGGGAGIGGGSGFGGGGGFGSGGPRGGVIRGRSGIDGLLTDGLPGMPQLPIANDFVFVPSGPDGVIEPPFNVPRLEDDDSTILTGTGGGSPGPPVPGGNTGGSGPEGSFSPAVAPEPSSAAIFAILGAIIGTLIAHRRWTGGWRTAAQHQR